MNGLLRLAYSAAGRVATALTHVVPERDGKITRSLGARRGVTERFEAWGRAKRDGTRALVWLHAPSVGEGLQARPLVDLLRAHRPDVQVAFTFFSPSAESFARGLDVDFADYLPFDTASDVRRTIDALQPTALVYAKLDVWPVLTEAAAVSGVRLGLVSGTVSRRSSRQRGIANALLHDAYACLDAVGAVSDDDASRLISLGVRREVVRVTGDTRYDQVVARADGVDRSSPLLAPLASERPTLVAGSTWPSDERMLLTAWLDVRSAVPGARLIIASHEPTSDHLESVERWAAQHQISIARLGAPNQSSAEVILVDRVGVLGDLYALATVAFVGGGFHDAGLHSVLEPAAYGAPVVFGPRHTNSRDAVLLQEADGGVSVRDAAAAEDVFIRWLGTPDSARAAGELARDVVLSGVGAAARSFALVERLLQH